MGHKKRAGEDGTSPPPKFTRWEAYTNEPDGSHRSRRAQGLVPIGSTLPDVIAGIARATAKAGRR